MRRVIALLLAVFAASIVAACGSSSSGSGNPLNSELSYFSADSPFVLTVATDPNSGAVKGGQALLHRFPVAAAGETALFAKLEQLGINYDLDVRPLFGNPVAFGLEGSTIRASTRSRFLIVWITKDAAALSRLVKKTSSGLQQMGTHDGATLYEGKSAALAVDGPTLVFASSPEDLTGALDRHSSGSGISQAKYAHAVSGLPQGQLVQAFGTLTGVLSTPRAANARRVPWVAAIRSYASAIGASSTGLSFQYRVDTGGAPLTSSQLPIAQGSTAPNLAGTMPIQVGVRDPRHVITFIESAEQVASPAKYADFVTRQADLRRKTGADVNTLVNLLTGDLIVNSDTRTTVGRVGVTDPAAAAQTIAKLASRPRDLFRTARSVTHLGGGFYAINEPRETIVIGVVGSQLVAGRATPAQLRAFAAAPASPAPNAQGSVAFRVALPALLELTLKRAPSGIAKTILNSLGDFTGWTAASTSALTGVATLGVS
jgi:hypothetical protein